MGIIQSTILIIAMATGSLSWAESTYQKNQAAINQKQEQDRETELQRKAEVLKNVVIQIVRSEFQGDVVVEVEKRGWSLDRSMISYDANLEIQLKIGEVGCFSRNDLEGKYSSLSYVTVDCLDPAGKETQLKYVPSTEF